MKRIAYCPHCTNISPQREVFSHTHVDQSYYSWEGVHEENGPECYSKIFICETCSEILVLQKHEFSEDNDPWTIVYPQDKSLSSAVPAPISRCYNEASRIQSKAPNAYAVMIRKALEMLCDDRGIKKGNLYKRLNDLVSRGEIPSNLVKMTEFLRELGNQGAHSSDGDITIPTTWSIDDFFRAVVEYVYVAPSKIKAFEERIKKSS